MNKSELIDAIAAKTPDVTKQAIGEIISAFTETVSGCLQNGDDVTLVGFGTFKTGKREARIGRNPRTGEEIKIAAANVPKFSPGKGLKDAVNAPKAKAKKK